MTARRHHGSGCIAGSHDAKLLCSCIFGQQCIDLLKGTKSPLWMLRKRSQTVKTCQSFIYFRGKKLNITPSPFFPASPSFAGFWRWYTSRIKASETLCRSRHRSVRFSAPQNVTSTDVKNRREIPKLWATRVGFHSHTHAKLFVLFILPGMSDFKTN